MELFHLHTALKGDKLRICLDPKDLNKTIRREHYPTPTVASMAGTDTFSVIHAKSGFLQVKLDYETSRPVARIDGGGGGGGCETPKSGPFGPFSVTKGISSVTNTRHRSHGNYQRLTSEFSSKSLTVDG